VLLTTGESRAVDESKDGGSAARTVCLWGSPFGGESKDIADDIRAINKVILNHYGHAGPAFVKWLIDHKDEWTRWRAQQKEISAELCESLRGGAASRMADYLASIEITTRLVHRAIDLPFEFQSPVMVLLEGLAESVSEADRAFEGKRHAHEWAVDNQGRFWGRHDDRSRPMNGWLGRWDNGWIGFSRQPLVDELRRVGYDAEACIRLWGERGWLKTNAERSQGRGTLKTRIDGEATRVVAVLFPDESSQLELID